MEGRFDIMILFSSSVMRSIETILMRSTLRVMAWNDSRLESELDFCSQDQVEQAFREAGLGVGAVLEASDFARHDLMQAIAHRSTLWRWFVLLALLALVGEVLVLGHLAVVRTK